MDGGLTASEHINAEEMKAELAAVAPSGAATSGDSPAPAAMSFIYTHRDYTLSYNGDRVIELNLTSENPRPLVLGETYPITYSVRWVAAEPAVRRPLRPLSGLRFLRAPNPLDLAAQLLHDGDLPLRARAAHSQSHNQDGSERRTIQRHGEVHRSGDWGHVFRPTSSSSSSSAASSSSSSLAPDMVPDETGWKLLTGDVFRAPPQLLLFSVLLGTGLQLFVLLMSLLALAALSASSFIEGRGLLTALGLLAYSLSSGAAGYCSASYYKLHGGLHWQRALLFTALFYPCAVLGVVVFLNLVAWEAGSQSMVLSGAGVGLVILAWLCVSAPLVVAGALWGRSRTQPNAFPCRVNAIRRLIPSETFGAAAGGAGGGIMHGSVHVGTRMWLQADGSRTITSSSPWPACCLSAACSWRCTSCCRLSGTSSLATCTASCS